MKLETKKDHVQLLRVLFYFNPYFFYFMEYVKLGKFKIMKT